MNILPANSSHLHYSRALAQKSSISSNLTVPAEPQKHKKVAFPNAEQLQKPKIPQKTAISEDAQLKQRKHFNEKTPNPILFSGVDQKDSRRKIVTSQPSTNLVAYNDKRQLKFLSDTYKGRKPVLGSSITASKIVAMTGSEQEKNSIVQIG